MHTWFFNDEYLHSMCSLEGATLSMQGTIIESVLMRTLLDS